MANKDDFKKQDENLENVGEALSNTGQWIEEHSNMLTWIVVGIAALVLGVIAINNYVVKPKQVEASNEIAKAVVYFQAGQWDKALNGDEAECIGFEEIANSYRMYQQGKLAALYTGICYFKLGDYEQAAHYLAKFRAKDHFVDPAANQMLGDAYVEMDDLDAAIKAFDRAVKSGSEVIAPMSLKKLGFVYMEQGDRKAAHRAFQTIKDEYPTSMEAQDIDKYIALTAE